jgi:uncharacterized protein (DUF305 family)
MHENHTSQNHDMQKNHYIRLLVMVVLSFISMYILMYAMTNTLRDVYPNLNQFYMAGLMTAPMIVIEVLLMGMMYDNKRLNMVIVAASIVAGIVFYMLIRQQVAITDRPFLRSMIPHHSSAILMCEKATLEDPEIRDLCESIITGQQQEIDQMRALLNELDD